jgi:transcription termination factor NusB
MTSSKDIVKSYYQDCEVLPPFIDIHISNHEDAFLVVSNQMEIMQKLFVDSFVDEKKIRYLAEQLNYIFEEMTEIDVKLSLTYHNWVFSILHYYIEKCIKVESYEIASNLKKFIEL